MNIYVELQSYYESLFYNEFHTLYLCQDFQNANDVLS